MASRYPPTPSFGAPFFGFPLPPSPIQSNGSNVPASVARPVARPAGAALPPSPVPARPPSTSTPTTAVNLSSFEANSQIPSSTSALSLPNFPPPPFPPELLRQFANSNLPPPPPPSLPPMPLPHLGFPPFQGPPPFTINPAPPQNTLTPSSVPSKNASQQLLPPTYSEESSAPQRSAQLRDHPSREEGELSDGELDDNAVVSAEQSSPTALKGDSAVVQMSPIDSFSSFPAQRISDRNQTSPAHPTRLTPRQALGGVSSTRSSQFQAQDRKSMGNVFQRQTPRDLEQISSGEEDSGSSYNPPSASTPDYADDPSDLSQSIPSQFVANKKPVSSNKVKAAAFSLANKTPFELRELAKGALLSLAPHNIRYSELVNEGLDPQLLRLLYEELGIKDLGDESLTKKSAVQNTTTQDSRALIDYPNITSVQKSPLVPVQSAFSTSSNADAPSSAIGRATDRILHDLPNHLPPKPPVGPSQPDQPQQPQLVKDPSQNESKPAPPPPSVPATNIAMERKDRIAQLLAAKTGKPVVPRSSSEKTPPPPTATSLSPAPATPAAEARSLVLAPEIKPQQTPKSKNKAQTELVRQKMESLRREAMAKAQAQNQPQNLGIQPQTEPTRAVFDIPPDSSNSKQSSRISDQIDDLISQASPAHISTSKIASGPSYTSRIPGLFMTTAELPASETEMASLYGSPSELIGRIPSPVVSTAERQDSLLSQVHPDTPETPADISEPPALENQTSRSRQSLKRPLAADSFDEPTPPPKRPFGRKDSYDQVEIVVSDDESEEGSEGVRMDLDGESEPRSRESSVLFAAETPRKEALANLPALTDFPSPRPALSSTTNVSTALPTPGKEKAAEDLFRAKNQEIEAMRRKIAEMEERRKAKLSTSQAPSPRPTVSGASPVSKTPSIPSGDTMQSFLPSATKDGKEVEFPTTLPETSYHVSANAASVENGPNSSSSIPSTSDSYSRAEALRQKLIRRNVLQAGLPDLNVEVERTQSKLVEVQARLAQMKQLTERREAELREARRIEVEVLEEATKLEEQLKKGLEGRDRFSQELQTLRHDLEAVPEERSTLTSPGVFESSIPHTSSAPAQQEPPANELATPAADTTAYAAADVTNGTHLENSPASQSKDLLATEVIPVPYDSPSEDVEMAIEDEEEERQSQDDTIPLKSQEPPSVVIDCENVPTSPQDMLISTSGSLTGDISHQSLSAPVEAMENELSSGLVTEEASPMVTPAHVTEDADEYDGSVSMSDSGSEDYEPAEPVQAESNYSDNRSDGYDPEDGTVLEVEAKTEGLDDFDDDYEPAEPIESADGSNSPSSQDKPMDDYNSAAGDESDTSIKHAETDPINEAQENVQVVDGSDLVNQTTQESEKPKSHFTPYSSPLASMKSFRFHPQFSELVPGGYRSLTYSYNIDSKRPFCPSELAGEVCQDPQCPEQHFQQMGLPDDKILVQMSSANDIKEKEERDRYVLGLKQVIADLRAKGVKDFARVASELAAYRRRFREEQEPSLA